MTIGFDALERDFPGLAISAIAADIDTGVELFRHQSERVLDTASVGKIFLLHRLLTEVDRGERSLEERVTRRPVEQIDNSGIWYLLQQDSLTLYDVAALIGATSDNAATNTLCRVIGLDQVGAHTRALGYAGSSLDDVVRWPLPPGAPRTLSHASAEELLRFVQRTADAVDLSSASSDTLQRWLGAGMDLSMVASPFGLDPLAHYFFDRDVWLWNKTGTISTVRADMGLVMSPTRRIAYAVLINWERGTPARDRALQVMRNAGDAIRAELGSPSS
ncbi:serine hydrolase [Microbacterium sp.]|uniref:serine hydrolase n=1 Tax=Microbacterium sp. TaxID=51671 RepID=UPI0028115DFE|nr:serine hydrolase [Microbacterium sp.]